ncbi:MAG: PD-(D/E)XK nuclease domain-containing protein, partial [Proteobacteria bacterium]|nr:PD-(D/E)XK nuclease domain-containing protein [Pseudomonadota bacterium]
SLSKSNSYFDFYAEIAWLCLTAYAKPCDLCLTAYGRIFSIHAEAIRIVNNSKILLDKTVEGDAQAVAEALSAAHEQLMSRQRYNHEAGLQSAIRFAYFYATSRYTIISELPAGKGYADVVFIPYVPNVPAMIVELKRNQTTGAALQQIENKQYFNVMDKYQGDLLLVAVNYDEKTNEHTCEIKRFVK